MKPDPASEEYFKYCMDNGKPYFGLGLCAQQTLIIRHAYMDRLGSQECSDGKRPYYILEIGSYAGMSTVTWAKIIQKYNKRRGRVFCVDPWKPYLVEDEKSTEWSTERIMNHALKD